MKKIGILNIQGAVEKHASMVESLGHAVVEVRTLESLLAADALILPGGESTSIGKQLEWYGLMNPLRERIQNGMPIFGTCAGMILLSKNIQGSDQFRIGVMDIEVRRNAYGNQLDSFEDFLDNQGPIGKYPAIFIRAPRIESFDKTKVEIIASYKGVPVIARQNRILAASFHPELTNNPAIHKYFIEECSK